MEEDNFFHVLNKYCKFISMRNIKQQHLFNIWLRKVKSCQPNVITLFLKTSNHFIKVILCEKEEIKSNDVIKRCKND